MIIYLKPSILTIGTKMLKNLCLTINTQCDWDCSYCIAETNLSAKNITKKFRKNEETIFLEAKDFIRNLNTSKLKDQLRSITLTGGEPGLLPSNKLLDLIGTAKNQGITIDINSNGRIFKLLKEPKFEEVASCISSIDWHLFPNLHSDLNSIKDKLNKVAQKALLIKVDSFLELIEYAKTNFDIEIRPLILLTKEDTQNQELIKNFLDWWKNEIINFKSEYDIKLELRTCELNETCTNKRETLQGKDKLKFYKFMRDSNQPLKIISDESLDILLRLTNNEKRDMYK